MSGPPYQIGPYQTIVGVHWAKKKKPRDTRPLGWSDEIALYWNDDGSTFVWFGGTDWLDDPHLVGLDWHGSAFHIPNDLGAGWFMEVQVRCIGSSFMWWDPGGPGANVVAQTWSDHLSGPGAAFTFSGSGGSHFSVDYDPGFGPVTQVFGGEPYSASRISQATWDDGSTTSNSNSGMHAYVKFRYVPDPNY